MVSFPKGTLIENEYGMQGSVVCEHPNGNGRYMIIELLHEKDLTRDEGYGRELSLVPSDYVDRYTGKFANAYISSSKLTSNIGTVSEYNTPTMSTNDNAYLKNPFITDNEKDFRDAGITNAYGNLTDEGTQLFVAWLFKLNLDSFKREVVDPINKKNKSEE